MKDKDKVRDLKLKALCQPRALLFQTLIAKGLGLEVESIFNYIRALGYFDEPDYEFIRQLLT